MPLDIKNLMNEIKKLNSEEDCVKCEFDHILQSLTLTVLLRGRNHMPAILALCSELSTDNTLLRFTLIDVPFDEHFDILLNFLSIVLQTNQTLQILTIKTLRLHSSPDSLEPRINMASTILENAMKSNPRLHLCSFDFSVLVEYRASSYDKYEVTLSPISNNTNIGSMLSRNRTLVDYANNINLYFLSTSSSNKRQVAPMGREKTSEPVESECRCTIS